LASFFSLSPDFIDVDKVEDWTGENHGGEPFFYYRVKCNLYHGRWKVASADGSCNSWEKKYRYRQAARLCPECKQPTIIRGKKEYGGGWVCLKSKGGCGAKFSDDDSRITNQEVGPVRNPDVAEQVNTILKMPQKRALIAATLIATGTSEYFTQDIEDFSDTPYVPPEPPRHPYEDIPEPKTIVPPQTAKHSYEDNINALYGDRTEPKSKTKGGDPVSEMNAEGGHKYNRPLSPVDLKDLLARKAGSKKDIPATEKQISLVAMLMDEIIVSSGLSEPEKVRHSILKYLTGSSSLKELSGQMISAILDWMKPTQDSGGAYIVDKMAASEMMTVWTAALEDAGQQELGIN
jgi:hypothetical protein